MGGLDEILVNHVMAFGIENESVETTRQLSSAASLDNRETCSKHQEPA